MSCTYVLFKCFSHTFSNLSHRYVKPYQRSEIILMTVLLYTRIFVFARLTALSFSSAMLNSPNTGLQNPMSTVGIGQPSTPTINTSAPIDPSSMQRAYAALGLPYSSQAAGQTASQQPPGQTAGTQNSPGQQQLSQQMRPINTIGKVSLACLIHKYFVTIFEEICQGPRVQKVFNFHTDSWRMYKTLQVRMHRTCTHNSYIPIYVE